MDRVPRRRKVLGDFLEEDEELSVAEVSRCQSFRTPRFFLGVFYFPHDFTLKYDYLLCTLVLTNCDFGRVKLFFFIRPHKFLFRYWIFPMKYYGRFYRG
jgi:hypothetical protein